MSRQRKTRERGVRRRRRRLSLRTRVTVAFTLGALLLSIALSALSYGLVRNYLIDQRERTAAQEAYLNAKLARDGLRGAENDPGALARVIDSLTAKGDSPSVIYYNEEWIPSLIDVTEENLPRSLRRAVADGRPVRQTYTDTDGHTKLGIGVPLPLVGARYFEVFSFEELERTLGFLGFSLFAAGLATTVAGAAVGRWASTRLLRPVADVATAAAAIAGGDLDTHLDATDDVDLGVLATSFNAMVDALRSRIERDTRFASDVSHELRSPLTTMATTVDVLVSRRAEMPEKAQAALDLLSADVARFQRLVEDLLEISRFDAGVVELHFEEANLAELVSRAVAFHQHGVEPDVVHQLPIVFGAGVDETTVRVDKRRVVQVIANLLENAKRYGGGAVRITVDAGRNVARIGVEDAGPGVAPGERAAIFERFFRGSASGQRRGGGQGSGLGLSLVAEHARLHGGRVWVEDGPGGIGARFVFELPIATLPWALAEVPD